MPPLLAKPRHAKPRELPATRALLVPVVLAASGASAFGGLAVSASADNGTFNVTTAASADLLDERNGNLLEQRASRDRGLETAQAAAAQAAKEQAAAEQAAAEQAAAEQAAAEQAAAAQAAAAADAAEHAKAGQAARPGLGRISSTFGPRWGRMHNGVDLAAGTGSPIFAVLGGTVTTAGSDGGYGKAVRIKHNDGTVTLYAHNSAVIVRPGQRVVTGEKIAREGNTGNSTGPHVHFEVRTGGKPVNPLSWLRARGVDI